MKNIFTGFFYLKCEDFSSIIFVFSKSPLFMRFFWICFLHVKKLFFFSVSAWKMILDFQFNPKNDWNFECPKGRIRKTRCLCGLGGYQFFCGNCEHSMNTASGLRFRARLRKIFLWKRLIWGMKESMECVCSAWKMILDFRLNPKNDWNFECPKGRE